MGDRDTEFRDLARANFEQWYKANKERPMQSELKAVAERVIAYASGVKEEHATELLLDAVELAKGRLADLAAREKEEAEGALAVDEEWLRSMGFIDGWSEHLVLRGWGPQQNGIIQVYDGEHWYLNGTLTHSPITRADVLALLRAVKIPIKPLPERTGE